MRIPDVDTLTSGLPSTTCGAYGCLRTRRLYPDGIPIEIWQDAVIHDAARSFRFIQRYARKTSGKGQYDAEKHAHKILNRWREATGRKAVLPVKQADPFAEWKAKKAEREAKAAQVKRDWLDWS